MTTLPCYSRFKLRALALSVAAALHFSSTAFAQEEGENLEEITVTGSRIRQTDGMATPVPVTTMTPLELLSFAPGSTVTEQLGALPQFFTTQTAQRGGPALFGDGGISALNMRGLGTQRTLVLLDGSRVVPADKSGAVNPDTLPTALMRSVDVVTGGASAAYGADALGGVVNFVLDREFEGLKFSTSTGMNEFNRDGKNWNFSLAGGRQFGDRLNVIASIEAREIDQIVRNTADLEPDWWQRWGHVTNPAWKAADPRGTNPQRLTLPWVTVRGNAPSGVIAAPGSKLHGLKFTDDGTALTPFVLGNVSDTTYTSGGPEAQTANITQAGGPTGSAVVGRSGFVAAKYRFNESIEGFAQAMVGRSESNAQAARTPAEMSGPWAPTVFRNNAFLPASVAAIMDAENRTSFRLSKSGSYMGELDIGTGEYARNVFTTISWSTGVDVDLPNGWELRASWQSGESHKQTAEFDSLRIDRLALATDAVRNPTTGAIMCNVQLTNPTPAQLGATPSIRGMLDDRDGSPLLSPIGLDNTVRDCVPFNIMGVGQISQAAADYIITPKIGRSEVEQDFAELLLTGELYEGWGAGALSFAAGLTWREQAFHDGAFPVDVDELGPPVNAPELGIRGIATTWTTGSPNLHQFSTVSLIGGGYDVWEAFGELNVPLWESASAEQKLGGSVSYRSSEYSSVGRVESWKMGLDFQLFADLRFRATKSRDVREATFAERFDNGPGGGNVFDRSRNNQQFAVTVVAKGNPNLSPEAADTLVAGLVYQPSWVQGLNLSADWYDVKISDSIGQLGTQRVVDECYNSNVLCDYVFRDTDGILSRVFNPWLNVAQARARGVDVEMSYFAEPDFFSSEAESLRFRMLGGYLAERSDTPLGGTTLDAAGARGRPDVTASITATYGLGPWSLQWQERFIESVKLVNTWVEGVDVDDNSIASAAWTNLRFAYDGELDNGGSWTVSLNVQNLFDRNPPIIAGSNTRFGSQSADNTYDVLGRRFQIGFNLNF